MMPPRFPLSSATLATEAVLQRVPSTSTPSPARLFSATASCKKMSRARQRMFDWINSREGQQFAEGGRGPRYLGPFPDQPFPLNPLFRSQPVLDNETRELIWHKIIHQGESIKSVSADMRVDVRRVAAVVRLKEVERQWEREGKQRATPYAEAVMSLLPKTSYREGEQNVAHEAVNEIHVHSYSMQQLFLPVSESRHFTREDAAKAFHDKMLSVDARSPQPQLIQMERDNLAGKSMDESRQKFKQATQKEEQAVAENLRRQREMEEKMTTRVRTERYEFRFREIRVDAVGKNGRSSKGSGWRYGAPLQDRKRGMIKIPTSVP